MDNIYINENGIRRLATAEEIAEMKRLAAEIPMPEPDPNEIRMQEIEAALIELAAMLGGA